jgi:hypothetical protein
MRNRFTHTVFFICSFIALLSVQSFSSPACAADSIPSDSLEVGISYIENVNSNGFHDFWKHGRGIELFTAMPLYYGSIQGGVRILSFGQKAEGIPGFQSHYFYLGLGKKWPLAPWLGLHTGIDIGSEQMWFDDDVEGGTNLESEFAMNVGARLICSMNTHWMLNVSGNYEVIFTHKPIRLVVAAVGVSYSFSTPHWVKEFLK